MLLANETATSLPSGWTVAQSYVESSRLGIVRSSDGEPRRLAFARAEFVDPMIGPEAPWSGTERPAPRSFDQRPTTYSGRKTSLRRMLIEFWPQTRMHVSHRFDGNGSVYRSCCLKKLQMRAAVGSKLPPGRSIDAGHSCGPWDSATRRTSARSRQSSYSWKITRPSAVVSRIERTPQPSAAVQKRTASSTETLKRPGLATLGDTPPR